LNELRDGWPRDAEARDLTLGPLGVDDAEKLALTLLDGGSELERRTARAVARESRGNAFLVQELARSNANSGRRPDGETLSVMTLKSTVSQRLERLSEDARRVVEVIAVGGQPLPVSVVGRASGVLGTVNEAMASLGRRRFVRTGQRNGREVVEATHDRIRDAIVELLPAATLREHHAALARSLEEVSGTDAEAIAVHWLAAGDAQRAVLFAEEAAERAAAKLAFDHAARLIRLALDNTASSSEQLQRRRIRLAQMLEAAGRSSAAADEYSHAAQMATGIERLELERSAAEQLVLSGRIDEGGVALRRVLAAMGMRAPHTALGAVVVLLLSQLRRRVFGLRFRERDAADVSRENRVRVEALRAVSVGLGTVNTILGVSMQARHLNTAMAVGDRMQLLKALCLSLLNMVDSDNERRREMLEAARGLAARVGPEGQLFYEGTQGLALYMQGRFAEAREILDDIVARYRKTPYRTTTNFRLFGVFVTFFNGALREEVRRGKMLLRHVEDRGDVYTAVCLRTTVMVDSALADDDPEEARRNLRVAMDRWTTDGFNVQHWYAMASEAAVELYVGDGARAYARIERDAVALKKSFLLHSRFVRGYTAYVRGCCAVASAGADPTLAPARIREARRMGRRLEREPHFWSSALALLVRAAAAYAEGQRSEAIEALRLGLERTEKAGLIPHSWAARYQLGLLVGGDEGAALTTQATQAMTAEGVRAPARMAAFLLPGSWSAVDRT
jgi:tetratricopeptide (TPR) repeat protein